MPDSDSATNYDNRLGMYYPVNFSFIKNVKLRNDRSSWIWKGCGVSLQKNGNKIRIIVRRKKHFPYESKKGPSQDYTLYYMIYFDVSPDSISYETNGDKIDNTKENPHNETKCHILKFHYKNTAWHVWQWQDEIGNKNEIEKIYAKIKNLESSQSNLLIDGYDSGNTDIEPVIYHPARDSSPIDKFDEPVYLEELHRFTSDDKKTITLVFAGERLRRHWVFYYFYRLVRFIRHGRTKDVESFIILIENGKVTKLDFVGIYSKESDNHIFCIRRKKHETITADSTHGDGLVNVKYYFDNKHHPAVFVNTANHAMAEDDGNPRRWKIEYAIWENDCPVLAGNETRDKIEMRLKFSNV